jgi:hypothetical protein
MEHKEEKQIVSSTQSKDQQMCSKCGGWKAPKNVATGYAGKFCYCEDTNPKPPESKEECTCSYGDTHYKDWRIYGHKKQCNIYINPESLEEKGEEKSVCCNAKAEIDESTPMRYKNCSKCKKSFISTPPTDSNLREKLRDILLNHNAVAFGNDCFDFNHCDTINALENLIQQERQREREKWIAKIEKIDTSGGGNGRRVVAQILDTIKNKE